MKKIIAISAIAASLFAANNGYEIGLGIGRDVPSNAPIDKNFFGNLRVGKYLPKNHILRLELEQTPDVNVRGKGSSLTRALVNVEHYFDVTKKFKPYAFIGTGYQWVEGSYPNNVVGDLGIGAKYLLNKKFDLFAEARELRDFRNSDNHSSIMLGVDFRFGEHHNTPIEAQDSDHDGVPNYLDKCPNTPAGVKVDKNGCAIDSDHDGVPNYLDKCPNTPAGVKVDKNGCPVSFNFDITFKLNSFKIASQFMPKIKTFANFLKTNPAYKAKIEGYTDDLGSKAYNNVLSLHRAKAVYEKLINLGINKNRLSFIGYGENNPIASNKTKEGRAKNRRVIAKLFF